MFDVYVRGKNQLLVIRRGAPLSVELSGGWRRSERHAPLVTRYAARLCGKVL